VDDYVPYEERIRQEREAEAAAAKAHLASLEAATALLRRLDGDRTDHYFEILLPLRSAIYGVACRRATAEAMDIPGPSPRRKATRGHANGRSDASDLRLSREGVELTRTS
jgi:hypothetical protein